MKVWKVKSKGHAFFNFVVVSCVHSVCDYYHYWLVNMLIAHLMIRIVWTVDKHVKNVYCLAIGFTLCNIMHLFPVVMILTMALEQELLQGKVKQWMLRIHSSLSSFLNTIPPAPQPMLGANGFEMFDHVYELLGDGVETLKKALEIEQLTNAYWIRPNGANDNPLPVASKPAITASSIRQVVADRISYYRWGFISVCTALSFFYFHAPGILLTLTFAYFYSKLEIRVRRVARPTTSGPIRNGIYLINVTTLGLSVRHGIGTCFNGVMHVPYHVCYAEALLIGKTVYAPYHISVEQDIVTYNGPPQFTPPEHEDIVLVNCETIDSRTTYRVDIDLDVQSDMVTWVGVSRPGESGSPVYVVKGDQLMLAGLAGRYYQNAEGERTEYTELNQIYSDDTRYRKHVHHPGYGKTFRVIPQIISKHLLNNPSGRVLVTGPTRVVCMELAHSLEKTFDVGVMVKDHPGRRNEHARVQIAAHATMLRLLMNRERCVAFATALIIDEAHFNDSATIMLRMYGQYMLANGGELHEISATLDDQFDDGSNFSIRDQQIGDGEVEDRIDKCLTEGKRVMVFVPSVKQKRVHDMLLRFKSYSPIVLSRETFTGVYKSLADEDLKLVITTDIAECGINVRGLDVVIDLSQKFDYYMENKVIHGLTTGITQASYVQRRGRVGREKQGEYYYVREPISRQLMTAAEVDASVMMTGREWSQGVTNPLDIYVTECQIRELMRQGATPTLAYLSYRQNGTANTEMECNERLMSIRVGLHTIQYIGCGRSECDQKCKGTWKWFDERIHDWMIKKGTTMKLLEL